MGMLRLVSGLGWLLGTGAPEPSVEIGWKAPAGCPDRAWVEARVARFLDRPLADAAVEPVFAQVEVTSDGGELVAEVLLRTGDREQRRMLRDDRCEVLAAATAFIIAVAIDPEAALAEESGPVDDAPPEDPGPEPSSTRAEDPTVFDGPTEPEPAEPEPGSRRPLRGAVRLSGTGGGGLLPGFAPGVGLAGALLVGRARVELSGDWYFERTTDLGSGRTASLRSWLVGAAGCFVPTAGPVEFPLCGGVAGGSIRGQSRGVDRPGEASIGWLAGRVAPAVAYVPSRWAAIRLGVDALVPVRRPRFTVENVGTVHEVWPVVVLGQLGVEVRFP